jgi:alcohol dehydrogenase class IV
MSRSPMIEPAKAPDPASGTVRGSAGFDWPPGPRVVFGVDRLPELGPLVAALAGRALLVVDAALEQHGTARANAEASLALAGVGYAVFAEVRPEPDLGTVRAAVGCAAEYNCHAVVGLGGGSTLDVAKCAALHAMAPDLFDPAAWPPDGPALWTDPLPRARLPLVQVPTTAATGAEISTVAAIRHDGRRRLLAHPALSADIALVDPALSATVPVPRAVAGGVEILCRILCYYLNSEELLVQDLMAEGLMRACVAAVDRIAAQPDDLEARSALSLACAISMTHVVNLGRDPWGQVLWYLQDAIRIRGGGDKGSTMAALLPAYLEAVASATGIGPHCGTPQRLARLGTAMYGIPASARAAEQTAARVTAWLAAHGLPTSLAVLGMDAGRLRGATDDLASMWGGHGRLASLARDDVERFFTAARSLRPGR